MTRVKFDEKILDFWFSERKKLWKKEHSGNFFSFLFDVNNEIGLRFRLSQMCTEHEFFFVLFIFHDEIYRQFHGISNDSDWLGAFAMLERARNDDGVEMWKLSSFFNYEFFMMNTTPCTNKFQQTFLYLKEVFTTWRNFRNLNMIFACLISIFHIHLACCALERLKYLKLQAIHVKAKLKHKIPNRKENTE